LIRVTAKKKRARGKHPAGEGISLPQTPCPAQQRGKHIPLLISGPIKQRGQSGNGGQRVLVFRSVNGGARRNGVKRREYGGKETKNTGLAKKNGGGNRYKKGERKKTDKRKNTGGSTTTLLKCGGGRGEKIRPIAKLVKGGAKETVGWGSHEKIPVGSEKKGEKKEIPLEKKKSGGRNRRTKSWVNQEPQPDAGLLAPTAPGNTATKLGKNWDPKKTPRGKSAGGETLFIMQKGRTAEIEPRDRKGPRKKIHVLIRDAKFEFSIQYR